jgi:hypothetical protein
MEADPVPGPSRRRAEDDCFSSSTRVVSKEDVTGAVRHFEGRHIKTMYLMLHIYNKPYS